MLVIRLARTGRTKYPTYRVVAAESARAATGKFVKILGHYNPHTKELVLDKPSIEGYVKNGAQPSNSVIRLLKREDMKLPDWVQLETRNRKPKHEPEAVAEAPATEALAEAAPAEEAVAETPAAEETTPEAPAEEAASETAKESAPEATKAPAEAPAAQ